MLLCWYVAGALTADTAFNVALLYKHLLNFTASEDYFTKSAIILEKVSETDVFVLGGVDGWWEGSFSSGRNKSINIEWHTDETFILPTVIPFSRKITPKYMSSNFSQICVLHAVCCVRCVGSVVSSVLNVAYYVQYIACCRMYRGLCIEPSAPSVLNVVGCHAPNRCMAQTTPKSSMPRDRPPVPKTCSRAVV